MLRAVQAQLRADVEKAMQVTLPCNGVLSSWFGRLEGFFLDCTQI